MDRCFPGASPAGWPVIRVGVQASLLWEKANQMIGKYRVKCTPCFGLKRWLIKAGGKIQSHSKVVLWMEWERGGTHRGVYELEIPMAAQACLWIQYSGASGRSCLVNDCGLVLENYLAQKGLSMAQKMKTRKYNILNRNNLWFLQNICNFYNSQTKTHSYGKLLKRNLIIGYVSANHINNPRE